MLLFYTRYLFAIIINFLLSLLSLLLFLLDTSTKLESPSSQPSTPTTTTNIISSTKITPGTQSDYSHFNSKSTIQDFDLLKVTYTRLVFVLCCIYTIMRF